MRKNWKESDVSAEILKIAAGGVMPTTSKLRSLGRNDLACQISRRGGFTHWANRVGLKTSNHDSSTGWAGESAVELILKSNGFETERPKEIKSPHDILINGVVKIDVKSAAHSSYGRVSGWFYRLGKIPQSDVIILYQTDAKDCFIIPWWKCPETNLTISGSGGKYLPFKNAFHSLRALCIRRKDELAIWPN